MLKVVFNIMLIKDAYHMKKASLIFRYTLSDHIVKTFVGYFNDILARYIFDDVALCCSASLPFKDFCNFIPSLKMIPFSILAGVIGFILQNIGLLELDQGALERIVYHGLALTFIGIGLQNHQKKPQTKMPWRWVWDFLLWQFFKVWLLYCVLQCYPIFGEPLHPGLGLLLPLGLNQGPGQALSMGNAWEEISDLHSGGQIGLILAASGFLVDCIWNPTRNIWSKRLDTAKKNAPIHIKRIK